MPPTQDSPALRKELGLFDVFAISTGAMFSSGFFLLPGLAAAQTGPSVVLAYLLASFFILPSMFSVAELSTAMPRAGGAYYFLDRSLGPIMGTIGGLGTWMALVLKSAFALVGMGAYLAIYMDVPIKPIAVGFTVLFAVVNIFGAKETSRIQRILVTVLLGILAFFILQGLTEVTTASSPGTLRSRFTPFLPFGLEGLLGTVGFVFVSYAGLTKVASVSEEVRNPERNIPLGMMLSLAATTFVYVVGVFIIVAVLDPVALRSDLTPVATAAQAFFGWLPEGAGVVLIVIAGVAAFASTGNAGILSASRYPLAMARDRLIWPGFVKIGRFGTPVRSIAVTAGLMAGMIIAFDIESIAKLASAFQLLLFSLLSLAVVVMRESRIEGYDPGYRTPLYPWMQVVGILAPLWLIAQMGAGAVGFTMLLVAACVGWYLYYARGRVEREGAILHTFARLGESRYRGLDAELRGIVKEKGLRAEDPFDEVVARAAVVDVHEPLGFAEVAERVSQLLGERSGLDPQRLLARFVRASEVGTTPVAHGAAIPHTRAPDILRPELVLVRVRTGLRIADEPEDGSPAPPIHALFFLLSPEDQPGQHLRLLGHLATHVDDAEFLPRWLEADDEHRLRETLLREERSITLHLRPGSGEDAWIGRSVREIDLPAGALIALVRRGTHNFVPRGSTVLEPGDRLTILGEPEVIQSLGAPGSPTSEDR